MVERKNLSSRPAIFGILIILNAGALAADKIIYVDDDAVGANDGSSWQNAYTFLQDALVDANSAEKPVEIRVARGLYKPNQGIFPVIPGGINARTMEPYPAKYPADLGERISFQLISGVTLKGGYAGIGETDPNFRDIEVCETILSGDCNSDDVDVNDPCDLIDERTRFDNSWNVVDGTYTDETAVLDGFTITGGRIAIEAFGGPAGGAGMMVYSGRPTLFNCTFMANASRHVGGGMYNRENSHPTLVNCRFEGNYAGTGGGMCNMPGFLSSEGSDPTLINCTFDNNYALRCGGGMYNSQSHSTLINCTFNNNRVVWLNTYERSKGGGIYNSGSNPVLTGCLFSRNSADVGGGILTANGSNLTLTNCTFAQNSAQYGSALGCSFPVSHYNDPSNVRLANCILWDQGDEIYNRDGSTVAITYSDVRGGWEGEGNIDVDPCFAESGYWADGWDSNAVWVDGDYHLKSQAGRWNPISESWVVDDVTSSCIDAGDPNSLIGHEPFPNGGIINMGAYGGTPEASKSPAGLYLGNSN